MLTTGCAGGSLIDGKWILAVGWVEIEEVRRLVV